MVDLEQRLRHELTAESERVAYARAVPPALARSVVRRRRSRITTLWAVGTCTVVAVGVGGTTLVGDGRTSRLGPTAPRTESVRALPPAPLAPRTATASAWTGREFFVWGGARGGQADSEVFADGATFDPSTATWRLLPPAPLTGRAGAVAVWTGSEVVVWGGNDATPGSEMPRDGAAFDPAARSWRRIAAAPAGRAFADGFAVGNRVVVAGGDTAAGSPAAALVYEPASDRWTELAHQPYVVDGVATASAVVLLSVHPGTNAVAVWELDPARATARALPSPSLGNARPQRAGLAWTGEHLVAAVTAGDVTSVMTSRGDAWTTVSSAPSDTFHPPVHLGFGPDDAPLWAVGDRLVSLTEFGVETLQIPSGRAATVHRGSHGEPCGAGAAEALAGRSLYVWGGESCRSRQPEVATGFVVAL